jgi:ABC-type branched-subunit amino acid transport system substrate-binding protein
MTRRLGPSVESSLLSLAVIAAVALVLSFVAVLPSSSPSQASAAQGVTAAGDGGSPLASGGAEANGTGTSGQGSGGSTTGSSSGGPQRSAAAGNASGGGGTALQCAVGRNGGSTDTGVTATSIKLAATVVTDGPGASFLAPEQVGLRAVVDKTNRAGGVCGRRISLSLNNDSWDAQRGEQYIQNFVEGDQVFALASSDSEGLRAADSYLAQHQVPVVGTDGMLIQQYRNPWIWPVATSTISTMHVMAKNAYDRGARRFAIGFDDEYHFGVEGAYAFDQAVKRLTGSDIPNFDSSLKSCNGRFCGIQPAQSSYASQAQTFNDACYNSAQQGGTCDFAAYLLEPDTALSFAQAGHNSTPQIGQGAAQPLFTYDFAQNCKSFCDGWWVWTGYNPPIGTDAGLAGVATYVQDVNRESSSVDTLNQFLEGGYDGMLLLVTALQKVGPNLTRAGLKAALDSMTYDSGLSSPLTWRPGNHFANTGSRAFIMRYQGDRFTGFADAQTGFIHDPWVGQDGGA